jgi:hypothetical protein
VKPDRVEGTAHEQARLLAAEAVDGELLSEEAIWLEDHLAACPECALIADEYRAIHAELSSLSMPEPPRDLWVRTQAALDAVDHSSGRAGSHRKPMPSRGSLIGSSVAVAVVVLVAGASLLAQTPISRQAQPSGVPGPIANGTGAPATPGTGSNSTLAVMNGTTYWISGENGVYQIKGGSSDCAPSDASCAVKSGGGQTLGTIASDSTISAALAPNASVAAVWTSDKVAILPLTDTAPTVSLDLLTPQPTLAPTAAPTPTPTASPKSVPSESASAPSASLALVSPPASPTPAPTATPTPVPATPTPTALPTPASNGGPLAILTGFEIVGRDPEFSPDGRLVAFSARPSDHSAGPEVFMWQVGDRQAHPITTSHSDLFAGWFGTRILISEIAPAGSSAAGSSGSGAVTSTSFIFDPGTGRTFRITRPMLMPAVDPSGQYVVYWSGTVEFDQATDLWQPGTGDLFFDKWSNLVLVAVGTPAESPTPTPADTSASPQPIASTTASSSATASAPASPSIAPTASATPIPSPPSASPALESSSVASAVPTAVATPTPTATPQSRLPQALPVAQAVASVRTWQVRWDGSGQHVAVWVADKGSSKVGRLSLFAVDPDNDLVDTDSPLLKAERVTASIQFDASHLLYTSAVDGKTYLQAVPPLQPSTAVTPGTVESSPQAGGSASATPLSTDRPGN